MNRFYFYRAAYSILLDCLRRIASLVGLVFLSTLKPLYACPLCKEALSNIKLANPVDLVKSYNISVLVMIIVPFSLVVVVGAILWRLVKRNQRVL